MSNHLSTLARRRIITQNEFWLIDNILPGGNLHVVVGDSGAGKSTWLFQTLHSWSNGFPIAGHKSHPVPWAYVSLDRGMQDTTQTLRRVGLGDWDCPVFSITDLVDIGGGVNIQHILEHRLFAGIKFFVLEGLQMLLPDTRPGQSQNKVEMSWVAQLRALYLDKGYTILAVTHRPKKASSGGERSGQRTDGLGSASLMGAAGTMIRIAEAPKGAKVINDGIESQTDQRIVTWNCRQFREFSCLYDLDDHGRFINEQVGWSPDQLIDTQADMIAKTNEFDLWLLSQPDKSEGFKTVEFETALIERFGISRPTVQRWLASAVKRKLLLKFDHGRYRKILSQALGQGPIVQ